MTGVGSVHTEEYGQVGHGGREQEQDGGSQCASGTGQNGKGLGRLERQGWRHGRAKLSTLVGYVSVYRRFYEERPGSQARGGTTDPFLYV